MPIFELRSEAKGFLARRLQHNHHYVVNRCKQPQADYIDLIEFFQGGN